MSKSEAISKTRVITLLVNNKSVEIPGQQGRDTATGRQIKQAAINQRVNLQLDFSLFKLQGNTLLPVGDDEEIHIHNEMKLRAVAPDDNS